MALEGRNRGRCATFPDYLRGRGLKPEQIDTVCSEMSPAYIKGISEQLVEAVLVFDYFQLVKRVVDAVNEVRKRERREFPKELKGVLWPLRKDWSRLTEEEQRIRDRVLRSGL